MRLADASFAATLFGGATFATLFRGAAFATLFCGAAFATLFCGAADATLFCGAADAATLRVGAGAPFAAPSAAIAAASPGDTVLIAPGEYFDCAVISKDRITVAGDGDGVVLTDKTCEGKALLVTRGADIVVRNMTLTRARVPDGNGAGIRAEGVNLTIAHVRFIDNQDGILAADSPDSSIRISDSEFVRNGRCQADGAHAIYVGRIARLSIEHTHFIATREGHHVKSRAARTELLDNDVADGPDGTSSLLVELPDGGDLLMQDNRLEKGPKTHSLRAAIMLGSEHRGPADAAQIVRRNTLIDDSNGTAAFVLNWGAASPVVSDNQIPAGMPALSTSGALLHRARSTLYDVRTFTSRVVDFAKRAVRRVI